MFLTEQEIFTTVANHLLAQGKQSRRGDACLYRGNDGTKCAMGCLIPDSAYVPGIEHMFFVPADTIKMHGVRTVAGAFPDVIIAANIDVTKWSIRDLCHRLQRIHDGQNGVGDDREQLLIVWKRQLMSLATERGLSTDHVPQLKETLCS